MTYAKSINSICIMLLMISIQIKLEASASKKLDITTNYPGGNGIVLKQEGNTIYLAQDFQGHNRFFYWNICVIKPAKGEYTFTFTQGEVIGPHGPAISFDGINWHWAGAKTLVKQKTKAEWIKKDKQKGNQSFHYTFSGNEKKVYFARHFPYQLKQFKTLLATLPKKHLKINTLIKSGEGRDLPLVIIEKGNNATINYLLTCRHHACESPASYTLEGIVRELAVNPPEGIRLHIIPFVDIDGVENGEQGKNRKPHDHNRDYINKPIYPETKAVGDYIRQHDFDLHMDMHSPGVAGEARYKTSFYNVPFKIAPQFLSFKKQLLAVVNNKPESCGKIYNGQYDNIAEKPTTNTTSTAESLRQNTNLVMTLEQNYFTLDEPYSQNDLVEFGKSFGDALRRYSKAPTPQLKGTYTCMSQQCIQNGSFEDGHGLLFPFGWVSRSCKYDPQGQIVESTDAHNGSKAVTMSTSGKGRVYILQKIRITKPGTYTLKGYVKPGSGITAKPYLAFYDYSTGQITESYPANLSNDAYQEVELNLNIPSTENATIYAAIIGIKNGKGTALFDDFSLKKAN